jgi:hypothetical protein
MTLEQAARNVHDTITQYHHIPVSEWFDQLADANRELAKALEAITPQVESTKYNTWVIRKPNGQLQISSNGQVMEFNDRRFAEQAAKILDV